ncbi:MAG: hypothetical protein NZ957_03375 [Thaumarchaeota archaeon]|nr:hypothetical protein [Candidatus Calditenuaceae archaeon]MDW8042139.1 hypothetical protein [Nitrososphaerota archaeon]
MGHDPTKLRVVLTVTYSAVTVAVSLMLMGRGILHEWPDFVHTTYGFPLTWGVHVTETFTGPANFWMVDTSALLFDLLFWEVVAVALPLASLLLVPGARTRSRGPRGPDPRPRTEQRLDLNKER